MNKITLITTIKNEASSIDQWLGSVRSQVMPPDEIIIVDGGSTDGSLSALQGATSDFSVPIQVISEPGANIPKGRNSAILAAHGDIIAVTDAGCNIDEHWLETLVQPIKSQKSHIASGFFKPDAHTLFERYLAAVTIPVLGEINPITFLPSSRSVAFRKDVWKDVEGYPEWLPICEDLVFDLKLKRARYNFIFCPDALVFWRPRTTIQRFIKQYYLYARGDGHAKLWLKRHAIRYATYVGLVIGLAASVKIWWVLLILFAAGLLYVFKFYQRFLGHYPNAAWYEKLQAIFVIPVLVMIGDASKMVGYPVGVWQRVSGKVQFHAY